MLDWQRAEDEAADILSAWDADGPGGTILGFDASGPRLSESVGLASLEHGIAFGPATRTRYASITKQFLCSAVLRSGLDLAAPLGRLVPGLGDAVAGVPLRRALDMTGGLPDLAPTLDLLGLPSSGALPQQMLFAAAANLPALNFSPGDEISYSNTGYRLTETALPAPLLDVLAGHLPGIAIRFPHDEAEPVPGLATGYWRHATRGWLRGRYGLHYSASGGMAGTAEDLMRWGQRLMAGRDGAEGLLDALASSGTFTNGQPTGYGLGLGQSRIGAVEAWGHGGLLPGYRNYVLYLPALSAGVVVLTNRDEVEPFAMALRVAAALTGQALPARASLPAGFYVEPDGPVWLESTGDAVSIMGAGEKLFARDGAAVTLASHVPAHLIATEGGLSGTLGGRAIRLREVDAEAGFDPALAGEWHVAAAGQQARLRITPDGMLHPPGQPAAGPVKLRPLGAGRALAEYGTGPGARRYALWLPGDGTLRLVLQRSRVLAFRKG